MCGINFPLSVLPFPQELIKRPLYGAFRTNCSRNRRVTPNADIRKRLNWQQTHKLVALDAQASSSFGESVTLDGNWAIVGADNEDSITANSGAVYIFFTTGMSNGPSMQS